MNTHVIQEGEGLNALSARWGLPACMLLRANGLYAPAWLLPGREIVVPERDYCRGRATQVCPVRTLRLPAWPGSLTRLPALPPELVCSAARLMNLPARLLLLARGRELYAPEDLFCETVRWGDDWDALSARTGETMEALMRLNRYWGAPLPGMRLAARRNPKEETI